MHSIYYFTRNRQALLLNKTKPFKIIQTVKRNSMQVKKISEIESCPLIIKEKITSIYFIDRFKNDNVKWGAILVMAIKHWVVLQKILTCSKRCYR